MAKEIKFNIKLAVDGKEQLVSATSDLKELRKVLDSTKAASSGLSASFSAFNQMMVTAGHINSAVGQIASTLNSVTEESRSFGAAMNAANTMAGKSGEDFGKLKGQVAELAETMPIAREELANGLYQVISNGVPEDNWIEYLQKSAKASVGGIADLGETVKVTSTVIKNYGLSWDEAGAVQDKIQLTAKNGVTSFEQLAQALPRVTSNAATLGVSIDELMATFSTLTGVSGNTNEVATQLAAVFTALVKPSSRATQMAQQMGIEFNAASIKAAGGMQNFLVQLDASVKKYAASSGMLEQEVYGKLFGSAESLRAIGPLTGQLAGTFEKNVEAMKGSAGTIDAAFDTMSGSGAAALQMMKNKFGEVTDAIAGVTGQAAPILNFSAQLGNSVVAVLALSKAFTTFGSSLGVAKVATVAMSGAGTAWNATSVRMNALVQALGASMKGAAVSTTTFRLAVQGLMIASGIGIAVVALTTAIQALASASDDAADGADGLGEALKGASEAYESTLKSTLSELMTKYDRLKASWAGLKTEQEKIDWVGKQQGAFDELGMKVNCVADAEALFGKNTQGVVQAFERRAQAAAYAAKLTELYKKQIELKDKAGDADKEAKKAEAEYRRNTQNSHSTGLMSGMGDLVKAGKAKTAADEVHKELAGVNKEIAKAREGMKALLDADKPITAGNSGSGGTKGTGGSRGASGSSGSRGSRTGGSGRTNVTKPTEETKKAVEGSIDWYEEQIRDLQDKLNATADEATAQSLKAAIEGKQQELQDLKVRIGVEKPEAPEVKTALEELQEELHAAEAEFDNAVTVGAKVAASAKVAEIQGQIDEATKGQLTIKADVEPGYVAKGSVEDKRQSYANAQGKASRIQQDYEIGIIGKEEAERQMADLNKQIADMGGNLKPLKLEVDTSQAVSGLDEMKNAWSNISGVANGVQQMTDAIEGNGDAWQTISGLMSGFFSVAEGIQGVVTLVNSLTGATTLSTAATMAKTTATTADTAAAGAHTAAMTTDAAATSTSTAAALANTTAKSGEAIAGATASGASLPFPANIAAIAAGVAAVVAALAMISGGFATGGVVGGTSTHGDKKFARVNSGEMILNKFQQTRLWNLIDGRYQPPVIYENPLPGVALPEGGGMAGKVEQAQTVVNIEMSPNVRKMLNLLVNEERVARKSGRRS